MRVLRGKRKLSGVVLSAIAAVSSVAVAEGSSRPFGDVRVFADVPSPGHPEGIAVLGDRLYVSTPNSVSGFVAPSLRPSVVMGFDLASAALASSTPIEGENPLRANALLGMAPGADQTLYVLSRGDIVKTDTTPARVLRLDYSTDPPSQTTYATIPDLPSCTRGKTTGCSSTQFDLRPVPNSIAFDVDGAAYVTDTAQAAIWKVKPGGGEADLWFTDPRVDALITGPNGGTIDVATRRLYFTTSPSPIEGVVWWVPLGASPSPADLHRFHTFSGFPLSVPDGLALGEKGVYIAFASDQAVVILDFDGNEAARIVLKSRVQLNRYGITQPAALAFDGTGRVLVTNGQFNNPLGLGSAVFDVWVDDPGVPLVTP